MTSFKKHLQFFFAKPLEILLITFKNPLKYCYVYFANEEINIQMH